MTHRGPFQPLPFCDSVILLVKSRLAEMSLLMAGGLEPDGPFQLSPFYDSI